MRKLFLFIGLLASAYATACTNFIVGKKASTDGSVICSYNADSYGAFMGLAHYPAAKHQKGEMRKIFEWDTNKYLGEIPEAEETWNVVGNTNEWQVTIGETTYGGREEMVDSTGIIDYGSLIYIALQRSKSAREAIGIMTSLAETYGYYSEGETFTICDADEAWIMEMQGCGPDRKVSKERVVWVARRIPDEAICGHANQSRIGRFPMKDKENVRYSKNVVRYARMKGWFSGKDADFSWKDAYAAPDFTGRRICDARVWSFFRHHASGMDRYLPWVMGLEKDAEDMPLWIVPEKKVSVADVMNDMRDHFENTPLAIDSSDIGAGIWSMPYRPTPLFFTVDGKKYLDCYAGVSVINCGHCNPEITDKICDQVKTLQHVCNIYLTENFVNLAEKLAEVTPGDLQKSFFCSTGTEANEGALLLASIYTKSSEFIALQSGLHGRTKLTMSLTSIGMWRTDPNPVGGINFAPNPYCYRCPLGKKYPECDLECANQVESIIKTATSGKISALSNRSGYSLKVG